MAKSQHQSDPSAGDDHAPARSPELLDPSRSTLLVVDVQQRLVPLIHGFHEVVWNVRRLLDAARLVSVPTFATEQYPQGLGVTVDCLQPLLPVRYSKRMFSCREWEELWNQLDQPSGEQLVVCGIESHVCVQQTVLDILADGRLVYVVADAIGSRRTVDHDIALRRMESSGATITTTESAIFEWSETSRHPNFKAISQLIQEQPGTGVDGLDPAPVSPPAE